MFRPQIRGGIVHFMLAFMHPIVDGNGHTARALFYWYILKEKPSVVTTGDKSALALSLFTTSPAILLPWAIRARLLSNLKDRI